MWGLESRSRTSRSRSRLLWRSLGLGLVSKFEPGLGLGGYGLDYITVNYQQLRLRLSHLSVLVEQNSLLKSFVRIIFYTSAFRNVFASHKLPNVHFCEHFLQISHNLRTINAQINISGEQLRKLDTRAKLFHCILTRLSDNLRTEIRTPRRRKNWADELPNSPRWIQCCTNTTCTKLWERSHIASSDRGERGFDAGPSPAGGQWCPVPPFKICAPHFTFGPLFTAYI